jgi:hypothetical protein
MWACIRYQGALYKVQKHLIESDEQAQDRAWYIAKHLPSNMSWPEKESLSRQWANEKYYKIKYNNTS